MHRTQYFELKNSLTQGVNDTINIKNSRTGGFMQNYEQEILNLRTQWYLSSHDCSSYRVHVESWEWTTKLKDFMGNVMVIWFGMNLNEGLGTQHLKVQNIKISLLWKTLNLQSSCWIMGMKKLDSKVYIITWNSCIRIFLFPDLIIQNIIQIDSWSQRIHNWTQYSWTILLTLTWIWIISSKSYSSW